MRKDKMKLASATNFAGRKKRNFENYFDNDHSYLMTPNQRSLPKNRNFFNAKSKKKQNKKSKRNSNPKKTKKSTLSPGKGRPHATISTNKQMRGSHSLKEYDSPSRDQQQMDMILQGHRRIKGNTNYQQIIKRVNELLQQNKLSLAINILSQSINHQPNNYDLNYLLGVCCLISCSYDQAINVFDNLLLIKPRKNIYLLLSVCYKKIQSYNKTQSIVISFLSQLQQCINRYPKYYQAYIYRGKLYLKLKQYKKALNDFQKALIIDNSKQIGFIGKGDCLRLMQRYEESKQIYNKALYYKTNSSSILIRRAICNIQLKLYNSALDDINNLLHEDSSNSQALYFKGLIYNKLKKNNQALICFQQTIKFNTNKKAVTRAIYEITKIKIQNRDYYQAFYNLERAKNLDVQQKVILKFMYFIDGATAMMRKNFTQGIKILTELHNQADGHLNNFLRPLFLSTRSYGYMSIDKLPQAKEDLDALQHEFSLDLANLYNKFICEGILSCNAHKYQQALALFSKASRALPYRVQPAFYKAVTLICFANKLIPKDRIDKIKQYMESAMKTIHKIDPPIEDKDPCNPSLYLIKGYLNYTLGYLVEAVDNFDKCIRQKPNPLAFYMNGLIFAEMKRYNDAIHELKKAIQHDEKHTLPQIYLNLAKCMLLIGDINAGFMDLQTYMSYRPSSSDIHIWAGHLLFYIGACQDAAKAYSNINNLHKNVQVLFFRAKAYLASKDVISTITNLKMILQQQYNHSIYFDLEMLQALRECSDDDIKSYRPMLQRMLSVKNRVGQNEYGNFFRQSDYIFYIGLLYFYEREYNQSIKNMRKSLLLIQNEIKQNKDELLIQFYKQQNNINRCYNYYQINYNIIIIYLINNQFQQAFQTINLFIQHIHHNPLQDMMLLLSNLISNHLQHAQYQDTQFMPFNHQNRLCSLFPQIILPLKIPIKTRLYFCLPYLQKPDINPKLDLKVMDHFDMNVIQMKAEAPWIKRSQQGVIFTDQQMQEDIELSQSSEHSQEKEEIIDEEDDYQHQMDNQAFSQNSDKNEPTINRREMMERLKLDDKTAEILSKKFK